MLLDAIFCYFYVLSKERIWFVNNSYGFYAWLFAVIFTTLVLFFNLFAIFSIFGAPVFVEVSSETGLPAVLSSPLSFSIVAVLLAVCFGTHLMKNRRCDKLILELKNRNEELTRKELWVGRVYLLASLLPFLLLVLTRSF